MKWDLGMSGQMEHSYDKSTFLLLRPRPVDSVIEEFAIRENHIVILADVVEKHVVPHDVDDDPVFDDPAPLH